MDPLCLARQAELGHRAPSLLRPGPWHPPAPQPQCPGQHRLCSAVRLSVRAASCWGPAVCAQHLCWQISGAQGESDAQALLTPGSAPGWRAGQAPLSSGFPRRPSSVSRDCQACFLELSPAVPATAGVMPTGLGVRHRFPCPSPLVSHQELSGGQQLLRKAGPGPLRYGGASLGTRKLHGGGSPGMR